MTDSPIIQLTLQVTLVILTMLLFPTAYRLYRGPRIADRMLAMDLITTLLTTIIVVYAVLEEQHLLIDIALALAALSFIATLGVGRYVSEGRVF